MVTVSTAQRMGRTWKYLGLEDTRSISRIRVHPARSGLSVCGGSGCLHMEPIQKGVSIALKMEVELGTYSAHDHNSGASDLSMDMD